MSAGRIRYLDGLRGVAILLVVLFHAYARWAAHEPFEQPQILRDLFAHGWLGVQLFFAISGYVILMTLHRSDNALMFGINRYLRLGPGMVIASLFIFATARWLPDRPAGAVQWGDLIPGLTFLDPRAVEGLTGLKTQSLDGAFWSLYIEVRFYLLAALLFFGLRDRGMWGVAALYGLFLGLLALKEAGFEARAVDLTVMGLGYWGVSHYGWFLLGIFTFRFAQTGQRRFLAAAVASAGLGCALLWAKEGGAPGMIVLSLALPVLFLVPFFVPWLRRVLELRAILFLGFVSYPLYLLHQNLVTGGAIALFKAGVAWPPPVLPLVCLICVLGLSYVVARAEPKVTAWVRARLPQQVAGLSLRR